MSDLPTTLDHCVIHVGDWEAARDFYTRVIGCEAVEVKDGYVFRLGDQQLNCHGPKKFAEPKARVPVEPGNSDLCFRWHGPIAMRKSICRSRALRLSLVPFSGSVRGAKEPASIFAIPMGR